MGINGQTMDSHRTLIKFALFLTLFVVAQPSKACERIASTTSIELEFALQFNQFRIDQEVEHLAFSQKLAKIAEDYACVLVDTGHFDHVGPDGSTLEDRALAGDYSFCMIAENLAKGHRSVVEVIKGWVKSPGHFENMRRNGVSEFGIAAALKRRVDRPDGRFGSLSDLAAALNGSSGPYWHLDASVDIVWVLLVGRPC